MIPFERATPVERNSGSSHGGEAVSVAKESPVLTAGLVERNSDAGYPLDTGMPPLPFARQTNSPVRSHDERMEVLGRLTMGVVHDFNNLLSGILGHVELMRPELASLAAGKNVEEHLKTIEQAALDGAALIRKIQQFVREENRTHYEPVNLVKIAEDCLHLTKPCWYTEPRRTGVSIKVESRLQPVPLVAGSGTELREVVVNLIMNAVDAMPEGGTLSLETGFDPARGVRLSVVDTGVGMSSDVSEHIFEPLFTTKGDECGTGMGLAVSYGIIREHDGKVEVATEPGRGTRFDVYLPIATLGPVEEAIAAAFSESRLARILVVDDEPMVRSVITRMLRLRAHTVEAASSAAEALALLEDCQYDIVITDHGMPEMNGAQLLRAISTRLPSLPTILLTGDISIDETEQIADAILHKPFKLDELETTIQRLLA
jgi:two-component system, cell cycle sensor histidine kinase and response regulator CckA